MVNKKLKLMHKLEHQSREESTANEEELSPGDGVNSLIEDEDEK